MGGTDVETEDSRARMARIARAAQMCTNRHSLTFNPLVPIIAVYFLGQNIVTYTVN